MIKIYRYNQFKNTVMLALRAPGGMMGRLVFDNGNVATRILPTVRVASEFWQQVIDESNLVKDGMITCIQEIKEDGDDTATQNVTYNNIEGVTSLQQAMDYCADTYEEKARTINEALNIAHQHGDDFPNLEKRS